MPSSTPPDSPSGKPNLRRMKHWSPRRPTTDDQLAMDYEVMVDLPNMKSAFVSTFTLDPGMLNTIRCRLEEEGAQYLYVSQDIGQELQRLHRSVGDEIKVRKASKAGKWGLEGDGQPTKSTAWRKVVGWLKKHHLEEDKYTASYPPCLTNTAADGLQEWKGRLHLLQMHAKITILLSDNILRLNISTGNLTRDDYRSRDNGVVIMDFPFVRLEGKSPQSAGSKALKFREFLVSIGGSDFIKAQLDRTNGHYDLSRLDDRLVFSDPTSLSQNEFGLGRLRLLAANLFKPEQDSNSPLLSDANRYTLDICTSSMDSLGDSTLLNEVKEAMTGGLLGCGGEGAAQAETLVEARLIYVTEAAAILGKFREYGINLEWMALSEPWESMDDEVKATFHHWDSRSGPVGHDLKIYSLWQGEDLCCILIGSHNLSRGAWGPPDPLKPLWGTNWECSVLLDAKAAKEATTGSDVRHFQPWKFELRPYDGEDRPMQREKAEDARESAEDGGRSRHVHGGAMCWL